VELETRAAQPRLSGDVSLAEITEQCASRMLCWMQQPDLAEEIGLSVEPSLERTLDWIHRAALKSDIRAWAIHHCGVHIGNIVFDQFDRKAGSTRMSVYLGDPESRGMGIGSVAIYEGLTRIFDEAALHRIWLTVHAENSSAIRVYQSLGFQIEGRLREAFLRRGKRIDALYFGLLRSEFFRLEASL
jgi:RimJ/RimL family protein N-acetyltransferase